MTTSKSTTVREILSQYATDRDIAPNTASAYFHIFKRLDVLELTLPIADLQTRLNDITNPRSRRVATIVTNSILGTDFTPPAQMFDTGELPATDDLKFALAFCSQPERAWVLFNTGMRLGEVCGLDRSMLAGQNLLIDRQMTRYGLALPKGKKSRIIPVSASTREMILTMDGPVSNHTVRNSLARTAHMTGIPITARVLRHHWATTSLRAGIDIVTVSKNLGHASIEITAAYYTHLNTDGLRGLWG